MKKHISILIIIVFLILLLSTICVTASTNRWFVNDSQTQLPEFFSGVYAVSSQGKELLNANEVFALSANGLQPLGAANCIGGGGLVSADGRVDIKNDSVKVGLYYYYSKNRDSSITTCPMANLSGNGFIIGIYDSQGVFQEETSTEESQLVVSINTNGAICVSSFGGKEIYLFENSGKSNYLYLVPIGNDETITKCVDKNYYGEFAFADLGNNKLSVINSIDIEQYVMGVCACEMVESWPIEALKAQAVASRTYVQRMIGTSVYYYSCGFDVTADTYCQAYLGNKGVGSNIRKAVSETKNQYLTYSGALIDALYSAADGGATEDSFNVFGVSGNSYLTGIIDPYEAAAKDVNPYSSWNVTFTPTQLGSKVGIGPVSALELSYSNTGNVIKIEFVSTTGQKATIFRDSCRTYLGLKNIRYKVEKNSSGNYVFSGSGFGHNVGMSQWGAYAMATYYQKSYQDILGFYYTKVSISYGVLK